MPEPSPPVEGQAQGGTQRGHQPPEPPPIPIRIVKSPNEAANDAAREAEADKHDAKDLDAQIRAANAAEDQWWPSWAAAILTALGTVLLVWTLRETRRTAKAAIDGVAAAERAAQAAERANTIAADAARDARRATREANRISREAFSADQRPWVTHVKIRHNPAGPSKTQITGGTFKFFWTNSGRSPAINCEMWVGIQFVDYEIPLMDITFEKPEAIPLRTSVMGSGIEAETLPKFIATEQMIEVALRKQRLFMWGRTEYHSVHDPSTVLWTEVCFEIIYTGDVQSLNDPTFTDWQLQCPAFGSQNSCR